MSFEEKQMAEQEKSEEVLPPDGKDTGNHQEEHSENSESMLKPWLKNLGKEFYQNQELAKYDTLPDAVRDLLKRPTAKEVPESFGLTEGSDEIYRKAGLKDVRMRLFPSDRHEILNELDKDDVIACMIGFIDSVLGEYDGR